MTSSNRGDLYFVTLGCGHTARFRGILACPYEGEHLPCTRCPQVNDHFQNQIVRSSPRGAQRMMVSCKDCTARREFRQRLITAPFEFARRHAQSNSHKVIVIKLGVIVKEYDFRQKTLDDALLEGECPF